MPIESADQLQHNGEVTWYVQTTAPRLWGRNRTIEVSTCEVGQAGTSSSSTLSVHDPVISEFTLSAVPQQLLQSIVTRYGWASCAILDASSPDHCRLLLVQVLGENLWMGDAARATGLTFRQPNADNSDVATQENAVQQHVEEWTSSRVVVVAVDPVGMQARVQATQSPPCAGTSSTSCVIGSNWVNLTHVSPGLSAIQGVSGSYPTTGGSRGNALWLTAE